MKETEQKIWIGDWDLSGEQSFAEESHKEFNSDLPILDSFGDNRGLSLQSNRRDFLKYLGFGLGAATVAAGCEIPLKRAIPYVVKPDDIVPGVANYYASSFVQGGDYCSVLVKTREGRPIKIEGNDLSAVTQGGTSARAQAVVLSLYDTNRFRGPRQNADASDITWDTLDQAVAAALTPTSRIRILTGTILSPTAKKALNEFKTKYPNTQMVSYDPVSCAALLKANEQCFGIKGIPDYHFDKAKTIVGIQADFLGTWISPVEYTKGYAENRRIKDPKNPEMSRHYQVESYFSLTGANADNRIQIRPSEAGAAIAHLHNAVASALGAATVTASQLNEATMAALTKVGRTLATQRGQSLVVCGTNNVGEQILVNRINDLLGNYGHTLDFGAVNYMRQGDESAMKQLVADLQGNQVDVLFVWGVNPVFDLPNGKDIATAIAQVPLSVSFAILDDETTAVCKYVAPSHHILESWGDAEPKKGYYSLIQPTISPLFNTRQSEESLLRWCASTSLKVMSDQPYYEYLKSTWQTEMLALSGGSDAEAFWQKSLHDGIFQPATPTPAPSVSFAGDVNAAAAKVTRPGAEGMEITFYETVNLGAGQYANNPWLMEMPDPVTRCSWGNYLAIPLTWDGVRRFVGLNGLEDGHYADLTIGGNTVRVSVIKQFGQKENTVAIALGYGRTNAGRCGNGVGVDVQPFLSYDDDGLVQYHASNVSVSGSHGKEKEFSCVQYHHTMGVKGIDKATEEVINADEAATVYNTYFGLVKQGYQGSLTDRTVIRNAHLSEVEQFIHDLQHEREHHQHLNAQTLYPDYSDRFNTGHHWGMHIDLNACTGCGACTVACMAENNVPVVGKKEVSRHHEMTWLRIDRYYYGDVENPNVVYQPLMCQHCDSAPCENVCPVNATNQSAEGLNQMAYNRCVGTRYCANNCPYKVRRFNWLDYNAADLWPVNERGIDYKAEVPWAADNLTRMVLNPDVTVRSRGVMEKCSFCVQRIQAGKLAAKMEGRALRDADVRSACQTACPAGAITFGDMNNAEGELSQKLQSSLNYVVLEEVNTRPVVQYQALINNRDREA